MFYISYYLSEINKRLFYIGIAWISTFLTSYFFKLELIYLISRPFLKFHNKFVFLDLTEAFSITIQICGILTSLIILPYIFYQVWSFFISSRYVFERVVIFKLLLLFSILVLLELNSIYTLIFPKICEFLMGFEIKALVTVELSARIQSYLTLFIRFCLLSISFFQIPFLFLFLYTNTTITCYNLCENRKIYIFLAILFSAFVSPPDFFSQLFLSFILFLVFEFLIFLGFYFL